MSRDYGLYLEDILENSEKASRYVQGMTLEQFQADEKTSDAVVYNLAIIGEAVKHVPEELRARYPDVEWRKIAAFRDIAIHAYGSVNRTIVWDIVQQQLPPLRAQVRRILALESPPDGS